MKRRILAGVAIVVAVTLMVGIVATAVVRRSLRDGAQDELYRQAEVTATRIEVVLGDISPGGATAESRRLAALRTRAARVLESARVQGGHDVVEAHLVVGNRAIPLSATQTLLPQVPLDVRERDVVEVAVDGSAMLATVRRIDLDSGALIIAIGRVEPFLPMGAFTWSLLIALGSGAILTITFGVWFSRTTGERLAGLERASREVAHGNLGVRTTDEGGDEIAAVSGAFNFMAEELEAMRRRERDFLVSVGHDLRTPLTTIRGYVEALDSGHVDGTDLGRVTDVLHAQTDRLSRLVEDVMLLARLEAREYTLRPEPVEVAAHLAEITGAYRPRAADAGLTLDTDLEDVGIVDLDPDRFGQICGNLIDNALRHTPERGTIRVGLGAVPEGVVLTVEDSGSGIGADDIPFVFERSFVARRSWPTRPDGSGLGLAIVREIATAMGAAVAVESEPGAGARFAVTFRSPTGTTGMRRSAALPPNDG